MKKKEIVNIKIFKESRAALNIVAAVEGKTNQDMFEELVQEKKKKLKIK